MTDLEKLKKTLKETKEVFGPYELLTYDSETKSYTARGDHRWDEYVVCKPEKRYADTKKPDNSIK